MGKILRYGLLNHVVYKDFTLDQIQKKMDFGELLGIQ